MVNRQKFEENCFAQLESWHLHLQAVAAAKKAGIPVLAIHYEDMRDNLRVL